MTCNVCDAPDASGRDREECPVHGPARRASKGINRRVHFLREAGVIERCHQTPHYGSYSVGLHSFNALNLILVLHPSPSLELVKAITWHDAAERLTGDIPATVKWFSETISAELDRMEDSINRDYGIHIELTPEEEVWLHAVDRLELLLWCKEQLREGNWRFSEFVSLLAVWFQKRWEDLPPEIRDFVTYHRLERTSNVVPGTPS
jgi:hypothetical protein